MEQQVRSFLVQRPEPPDNQPNDFQVAHKTVAFTWVKRTPKDTGFHFGLGYWSRANPEICLLGTRGHPRRVSKSVANLVISPLRAHSQKPDEVRKQIVSLCGDLPRAELFARQKTPGW